VVDDFTRECLAAVADTSISGTRVARELKRRPRRTGFVRRIEAVIGLMVAQYGRRWWY
jgi:putative transposase